MFAKTKAKLSELHQDISMIAQGLSSLDQDTEVSLLGRASRGVKNVGRAAYLRIRHGSEVVDVKPTELRDVYFPPAEDV